MNLKADPFQVELFDQFFNNKLDAVSTVFDLAAVLLINLSNIKLCSEKTLEIPGNQTHDCSVWKLVCPGFNSWEFPKNFLLLMYLTFDVAYVNRQHCGCAKFPLHPFEHYIRWFRTIFNVPCITKTYEAFQFTN